MTPTRRTGRLAGLVVLGVSLLAAGVAVRSHTVLVAALLPVAYLLYGQLAGVPALDVSVDRTVDEERPAPGSTVEVTVTVRNTGDRAIPKLHVVDGVPPELGVTDGSPRYATPLRPGESATFSYAVAARRRSHRFGEVYVAAQGFAGTTERETAVTAAGTAELTCQAAVDDPLPRTVTDRYAGQVPTDEPGAGLEFYATREYRRGDPTARIDWNRYAREGELATVEFRERRGAPVVVVVDARSAVDVARRPADPPASELAIYAAGQLVEPLLRRGSEIGLAFVTGSGIEWLAPGRGSNHEARIGAAVREAADREWSANTVTLDVAPEAAGDRGVVENITERLPTGANLVVVSPLLDDFPVRTAEYSRALGHAVSVLGPDVTARDSPGERMAAVDRVLAIRNLRRTGCRVVSWHPDDPLAAAVARTLEGEP
ncbi:MAG: DUF58 domain-containing protein [Salinirussus sp.]